MRVPTRLTLATLLDRLSMVFCLFFSPLTTLLLVRAALPDTLLVSKSGTHFQLKRGYLGAGCALVCIGGTNQEFGIHQQALLREYSPFDLV